MTSSHKRYVLGLAGIALAVGALVVGTACYLEPVRNEVFTDLLRIGGFTANRYGHNKPHRAFQPKLIAHDRYERYFDVVVLGDSFTAEPLETSWANYLAAEGLSVLVLQMTYGEWTFERLLSDPVFKATPPKVLIYQTAERNVVYRLVPADPTGEHHCGATGRIPAPRIKLRRESRPAYKLEPLPRPTEKSIDEQQISYARDFLLGNVRKRLSLQETPEVQRFELNISRFSARDASSLLVLSGDLRKSDWTPADIQRARCQLLHYRDQIHANGATAFVVLVAPDKLTAYHPDLVDPALPSGVIDALAHPWLLMPRVHPELRKTIEKGEIDVYLPGDSHWGAKGHEIVGRIMVETLRRLGGADARSHAMSADAHLAVIPRR